MKIRDIRDPHLFQRLVQKLYIAERGQEFQVVDDSGGDRGNDGYDVGRQLLFAIYCPEKPDTADYRRKALSDLRKAIALKERPGYSITSYLFITPTALREPLQAELRALAEDSGLTMMFVADDHLEDMYRRHPHLHDEFPELEYPRVAEALEAIKEELGAGRAPTDSPPNNGKEEPSTAGTAAPRSVKSLGLLRGFISPTLGALGERLLSGDADALPQIERFRMESVDPGDVLGALLIELEYETDRLNFKRSGELAREGHALAREFGVLAERGVFAAHHAYSLVLELVHDDINTISQVAVTNSTGAPLITAAELATIKSDLESRKADIDNLMAEAVQSVNDSGDIVAQFIVALRQGTINAQRYLPYHLAEKLGVGRDPGARTFFLEQVNRAYGAALKRAKVLGQEQLAQAYHNFANDLVLFGEYDRARSHAEYALSLAKDANDQYQIERSNHLLAKINRETGR